MNRSLLIVEDDPAQLDALTHSFIRAGYRVVSVHHPRQALQAASFRQFQVALLDASLPEMDGFELMQRLKKMQHDIRVIIVSGFDFPIWRAKSEGALICLTKPYKMPLLEAIVVEAFEPAVDESLPLDYAAVTDEITVTS